MGAARALYFNQQALDRELEALGLTRDDYGDEFGVFWVFPQNREAVVLFEALRTQWRTGFGGPTGLDYSVLPTIFQLHGVKASRRRELFEDLRAMEIEVLTMFGEQRSGEDN